MEDKPEQSLLSTGKASDSRLQVQLHPLVILTISDYVTRHTLRQQEGPIVGAIIGAQNGRDITMEHAFECKLEPGKDGDDLIDSGWFHDRLQQYRDVHKAPALDFVAWFTLAPLSGPQTYHLPIHNQLLQNYNESILLLALHPSAVADGTSRGGKLPLTIYETLFETEREGDDKRAAPAGDGPQLVLRFQELPYTIETGEAEMIAVDFVARGGASAASAKAETAAPRDAAAAAKESTGTGTGKAGTKSTDSQAAVNGRASAGQHDVLLSPEDEELIASLTAKANAIRMLQQRLNLIKAYLNSLPPCYLNTPPPSLDAPTRVEAHPQISHPVLRTVASLLARLPLLTPTSTTATDVTGEVSASPLHARESLASRTDVALTSLLGSMGSTLRSAHEMGRKANVVEHTRAATTAKNAAGRRLGMMSATGNNSRGGPMDPMAMAGDGEGYFEGEEEMQKEFATSLPRRR